MDQEDMENLSGGAGLLLAGLPWEGILEGARVYADTLRKLAMANANMTHRFFCLPFQEQGLSEAEINTKLGEAVDLLAPASQALVNHLLLDFMGEALIDHAISHLMPPSPDLPAGAERATIVFADLALFSTIAELQGDEVAFGLIDRTDSAIRELLVRHQGRLVKQIGDEFMLIFVDPVKAIRFASDLQLHLGQRELHVAARIGMHTGTVIYRLGDYYGRAVNVASRIASMAMPNSILVTEPMAQAASKEGIGVEEIGVRSLRGMEDPVSLYRVVPG
jgi:adenylate cyclase